MQRRLAQLTGELAEAVARRRHLAEHEDAATLLAMLAVEYPAGDVSGDVVGEVAQVFGLTDLDCNLLVVAAAAELDVRFGALYGLLLGGDRLWPSAGLALELCGQGSLSPTARARLGPGAPLRRHRLVFTDGTGLQMLQSLRTPERVIAHLLGERSMDAELDPLLITVPARCDEVAHQLARALGGGLGVGHVRSRGGTAGLASAVGAWELLGLDTLVVDLSRRAHSAQPAHLAAMAVREAGLLGQGLVLTGVEDCLHVDRSVMSALESAPIPVLVVDDMAWEPGWLRGGLLTVDATELTLAERGALWGEALADGQRADPVGWTNLLNLRIAPQDVAASLQTASLVAAAQGALMSVEHLRDAARSQGRVRLESAASRVAPRATLADLILPEPTRLALQELVSWGRNREVLLAAGKLTGRGTKGHGLTAMFAGSPGTGKTLAAEAVAGELGLELCTVDLSLVVDKYIGETEKHLERVIREAENLNVVLFFDEADALFGSRSSVSDARDRYANQEVSYLLQRIERFEGLAVLATNLRGNLDPAFTRRLHHIITFVDPDAATRRLLWAAHLQEVVAEDPDDPLDLDWLAQTVELTGGDIRNIVMTAAFAAATEYSAGQAAPTPGPVGMRHVRNAAHREYVKLARHVPPDLAKSAPTRP